MSRERHRVTWLRREPSSSKEEEEAVLCYTLYTQRAGRGQREVSCSRALYWCSIYNPTTILPS